uniref:hypothetical protein n=1 Tax=Prevotella sp. TaxID=59823 RepID=UPI0040280FF0
MRIAACPHRRHRPAPHTAIEGVGGLLHHSPSTVEGLRERHASLGIVTQLCHPAPPPPTVLTEPVASPLTQSVSGMTAMPSGHSASKNQYPS